MSRSHHNHQAPYGNFILPKGLLLKSMCAFDKFLEIYKVDKTFKILTPDSVDPNHIDPNTPWISTKTHDVGSQNKIISRIILQGDKILKSARFRSEIDVSAALEELHRCKEELLSCEEIYIELAKEVDGIISRFPVVVIRNDKTRHVTLPSVFNLSSRCGSFLSHAKKAIKSISKPPSLFIKLPRQDNNFKSLSESLIEAIGTDTEVTKFVKFNINNIVHIILLRNHIEHPEVKTTNIRNFHYLPGNKIAGPQWYITWG